MMPFIEFTRFLSFYLIKCPSGVLQMEANIVMVNPGDRYLSSELLEFPLLYMVAACIWVPVLLVWVYIHHTNGVTGNAIQKMMIACPTVKLISLLLMYKYFSTAQESGHYHQGLQYAFTTLLLIVSATIYGTLMLLAKGLFVIRSQLNWSEIKVVCVVVMGYTLTFLAFTSVNDYVWVFWFVIYILCSASWMQNARATYQVLASQLESYRNEAAQEMAENVRLKLEAFVRLMHIVSAFILADLLGHFCLLVAFKDEMWLSILTQELLQARGCISLLCRAGERERRARLMHSDEA
jgi:hypothetical protein